jgi:hypothetical protein
MGSWMSGQDAVKELIKARVDWVQMNKHLNVLMHMGHMESPNLVASCVTELDDTLPPYGCYTG